MNEASPQKNPSIGRGVWQSFMMFTVIIIAILWVTQSLLLTSYYKDMKERQILKATRQVESLLAGSTSDDTTELTDQVNHIASDNNVSIVISYPNGLMLVNADNLGRSNILFSNEFSTLIGNFLRSAQAGTLEDYFENLINPITQAESILVVRPVTLPTGEAGILFLAGSIEPVWATQDILRNQLVYITIIFLGLSAIIALFLSRRISRPITGITESAKKLAMGDYTPNFEGGVFQEVNDLADTLNGVAVELGRVESLRRELVANVSHDLRTPLTMIKAYAEMIRDITGDKPEKRGAQLGIIVDEADRLGRLVNDLVAISREETSGEDLEITDYDIVPDLIQLGDRFRMSYPDYQLSVGTGQSCVVAADRDRINQVLYNLASNAVSYTGDDKFVQINQTVHNGKARIEVLDSGPGIPSDEVSLIWQRYYRSSFHKMAKAGTGLGLSIVKEVMDAHGSGYGVTNRPEGGSRFWIEIPLADHA